MILGEFESRYDIFAVTHTKALDDAPLLTDSAFARPQNRICDLGPNEWALARPGSVVWDTESKKFTIDTWNDCIQNQISYAHFKFMPVVMRACVEIGNDKTQTDYVVDLRYLEDTTNINRQMNLHDEDPCTNRLWRSYQQSNGSVVVHNIVLPEVRGSHLQCHPDFEEASLELIDLVDAHVLKSYGSKRPRDPEYIVAQRGYEKSNNILKN